MLSSSTASAPRASASSSWASVSTSTSILTRWPTLRPRPLDRRANAAGDGDVVVLDQDGVVEAEAVIGAAAGAHGVFLDRPQARRRLARADDLRLVPADGRDDRCRRGGDAAQMAEEIERRPFRREYGRAPARSPWR